MGKKAFLIHWHRREWEQHRETLREAGWEVAGDHADGSRAMKGIKAFEPDVVVISLDRLPSHGKQVAGSLKKLGSPLPVVYFTREENADRLESIEGGETCLLEDLISTLSSLQKT